MEKIRPEAVVEILRKHGTIITTEEAVLILDFLHMLANIAIAQYLRNENR